MDDKQLLGTLSIDTVYLKGINMYNQPLFLLRFLSKTKGGREGVGEIRRRGRDGVREGEGEGEGEREREREREGEMIAKAETEEMLQEQDATTIMGCRKDEDCELQCAENLSIPRQLTTRPKQPNYVHVHIDMYICTASACGIQIYIYIYM